MAQEKEHLNNIAEIKNLMVQSSRFISLSGISGIFAGIVALAGTIITFFYLNYDKRYFDSNSYFSDQLYKHSLESLYTLFAVAIIVLILAIGSAIIFTTRKAKKQGLLPWDSLAKKMVSSLLLPLIAGGIFCLILLYYRIIFLIAPATLLFYGLALLNASKYTLKEIKYLGICEIALGLIASFFTGYGIFAWALGFGLLHIVYGTLMHFKYER